MILSKVTNKFVLFQKIPLLIKRHVYSINVKAFSLIESRELTTVDFEFFSRDILEDFKGVDRNDIEIRQQRIILHKGEEMIEYKLINNKIIKVVNDRGNITMINNVTAFTANIYYKSIIKITITVKVGTNLQTKTIYV
ncbi:TPA: competence protein ComGF [Staphylococcus aureus]|nr:competence protein ComGF [Staphylococcus aureus]